MQKGWILDLTETLELCSEQDISEHSGLFGQQHLITHWPLGSADPTLTPDCQKWNHTKLEKFKSLLLILLDICEQFMDRGTSNWKWQNLGLPQLELSF